MPRLLLPSPRLALAPAALAAAAFCAAAQAQTAPDAAAAPPEAAASAGQRITITGQKAAEDARGPVAGYRALRSTTATRTDTPLAEVPQSVSVIGAEQMRDQNAQTMQEVLRYTAGVHADVYGLDNRGDWFNLRGGSEGSTLLDGLRLPLTGWYGVVRNEPYAFERVEVLRGPASVAAGQNGPGGVVNLVSKRPLDSAQREISLQLGEHEHRQLALDLTGPLDAEGTLLYRLVALARDSGTQVNFADMARRYVAPSLTWRGGAATLTGYVQYQDDHSRNTEGFFPLEGTLYDRPGVGRIPLETFVGEPAWDTYGGRRWRAGWDWEQRLDERWTLRQRARHDDVKGGLRSMYANYWEPFVDASGAADPANGRYLHRTWYASDDRSRITSADLVLEGRLGSGAVRHTLVAGIDAMQQKSARSYWNGAATPLDVYSPVYGSFTPVLDAASYRAGNSGEATARNVGVFVQDQVKFGERWVLVGGLRRDRARNVTSGGTANVDTSAWSKQLGLVWLAGGGWSPYASYAESFEPVSGANAQGAFRPKRGKQLETGAKWGSADGRWGATAAVYTLQERNRLTDEIGSDGAPTGGQVQRGRVDVKGLELEANARLPAWDLVASFTRTATKDRSTDTRLANVPERSAAVWAVHRFSAWGLPRLRAGLGVRHVGATWDGADTLKTDSATLVDAMAAWDTGDWLLALNVSNLADKTYFAACLDRGDCWYGSKRKAVATVTYRF